VGNATVGSRPTLRVRLQSLDGRLRAVHLRYIERHGVTRDGLKGHCLPAGRRCGDLRAFQERGQGDRHQFRFIVSPRGWAAGHRDWARPRHLAVRRGSDARTSPRPLASDVTGEQGLRCVNFESRRPTWLWRDVHGREADAGRFGLCGLRDGYPRVAPTGTPFAVDGILARLAGRVSMELLTIDLEGCPNATIGSAVQLWGDGIDANALARAAEPCPMSCRVT
jgi:hypothetical protein